MLDKRNQVFWLFLLCIFYPAFLSQAEKRQKNLSLSQKKVLKAVLKDSPFLQKIKLEKQKNLSRLLETEYSFSHLRAFSSWTESQKKNPQLFVFESKKEELTNFNIGLEKSLPYGLSLKSVYSDIQTSQLHSDFLNRFKTPENIFRKKASLQLDLGLLEGLTQHWTLKRTQIGKESNKWLYYEKMEELALQSAGQYWKAYLAWTTYQQSKEGLKIYRRLVRQIQNKKKYGFLKPGERPQILAEYERIQQEADKQKQNYEKEKQNLCLFLKKDPKEYQILFEEEPISPPPSFPKKNIEEIRFLKMKQNQIFQQELSVKTHQAKLFPNLQFKTSTGFIPGGTDKNKLSFSSKQSFYEVGLTLTWALYSKSLYEKRDQEKYLLEENKIDLAITKQEIKNKIHSLEEDILIGYKNVQRAKKANTYQKQAFRELRKSFEQGRVDIFELIHTERKLRESEVQKKIALSEYALLLLQNQALRDQLVEAYLKI